MGWAGGERHGAFVGPHAGCFAKYLYRLALVSAPMAQASQTPGRAAVQRNLAWMEAHGLIREVTGHGRYRMWFLDN